ncbi:uncharacterized protein LOC133177303 [Saccostrea echinata]|uniref:uncharacterized protein LOC133177303 n=1 Tax=Saccostrea echinata TaxID=191078 RepID=UPI002A83B2D1|nr:uncharacterized protein LOC133177303 [Saccostrea echinata]
MWRIFLLIFNLVSATNEFECSPSIPTLNSVKRCPGNRTEWIQASNKKHCGFTHQNCSSKADFQYHCLLAAVPAKFAARSHLAAIIETFSRLSTGHFCPFYNSKKARVENHYNIPCQDHSVSCPQHYRSNEVYKYQECYSGVYGTQNSNSNTRKNEMK